MRAIMGPEFREAGLLNRIADRIEKATEAGSEDEYVFIADAAAILNLTETAVRMRCKRKYLAAGLAQKRAGIWYVHIDALTGKPGRAGTQTTI